jgi:phosphate transport system protein
MMITKKYVLEKITGLRNDIIEISGIIRSMLNELSDTLKCRNISGKDKLIDFDTKIKKMHEVIEESNIKIVAEYDLEENDIRLIIGRMRIISNFEKISYNVIRIFEIFTEDGKLICDETFVKMMGSIIEMFDKAFIGFTYMEIDKCSEVISDDRELDKMKYQKIEEMIERMKKDKNLIMYGVNFSEIVNTLERIGDYLTNVSEDIIYIFAGIDVRHNDVD